MKISLSIMFGSLLIANVTLADEFDSYRPADPGPRSDFDRAIDRAPQEARQPPAYTPPDPHEGRIPAGPHGSVGGTAEPSLNYRRDY